MKLLFLLPSYILALTIAQPGGTCGSQSASGGDAAACPPGQCCSRSGYCGNSIDFCGVGCQVGFGLCQNDIIQGNNQTTNAQPPQQSAANSSPQPTSDSVTSTNANDSRKVPGEQSLGTKFLVAGLILGGLLGFIGVLSSVLYISNKKKMENRKVPEFKGTFKPAEDDEDTFNQSTASISQVAPLQSRRPSPTLVQQSSLAPPPSAVRPTYRQEYSASSVSTNPPPPPKDQFYAHKETYRPIYSSPYPAAPSTVVLSEDAQKILMKRALQQNNGEDVERKETAISTQANYAPSEHGN
ncbi:hypothetical protein HDV06_006427 [Boothiomyces sp. JEL0866]|nr:hypothetical protein HDV06_006427 [Boothiomyces sp. JEL0866]